MTVFRYTRGAELPGFDITWYDPSGTIRDFSAGWTFTGRIGNPGSAALVQKTAGFTGAATAPNLSVPGWTAAELDDLPVGSYHLDVIARFTGTSQDLVKTFMVEILPGVLAPVP